jgi:hypothetical protein
VHSCAEVRAALERAARMNIVFMIGWILKMEYRYVFRSDCAMQMIPWYAGTEFQGSKIFIQGKFNPIYTLLLPRLRRHDRAVL